MKVLIIGRHETLYETARQLGQASDHDVVAVITAASRPEYRRHPADFEALARALGASFYQTQQIDDRVRAIVQDTGAEVGISVNWVSILPPDFLSMLPHGILNAHFGDLPRYRGNAVTNWGMLLGEPELVLTVHRMAAGLDAGDILLKKHMPLTDATTIADVNRFSETNLPAMFANVLDGLESGDIVPQPQDTSGLTPFRCYPRLPRDGHIGWALPARKIDALVRSLTKPYSGAYTYYRARDGSMEKLYVWETRVVADHTADIGVPGHVIRNDNDTGESWIYTGDGILALRSVSHGEHGEPFAPGATWHSIRMRLGMDVEEEMFRVISGRDGER